MREFCASSRKLNNKKKGAKLNPMVYEARQKKKKQSYYHTYESCKKTHIVHIYCSSPNQNVFFSLHQSINVLDTTAEQLTTQEKKKKRSRSNYNISSNHQSNLWSPVSSETVLSKKKSGIIRTLHYRPPPSVPTLSSPEMVRICPNQPLI